MGRPSKYPRELRERAVRMVAEVRSDYPSEYQAMSAVAQMLGVGSPETIRTWIRGSSDFRWGSWGEAAGGEEHAEAVVVAVAVAAGEAAVQLDDPVHRLGSAVR